MTDLSVLFKSVKLPGDVIAALELNRDWMRSKMPQPDSFFDVSAL